MNLVHLPTLPYHEVMDWSLRELRVFVTAAEAGSFTGAAAQLYVSQAAVSRTVAGLERTVGDVLLRRVPRGCELTSTGQQVLPQARRVLAEADRFTEFLTTRHGVLRLGYAWAGLGRHTARLQRDWARCHEAIELELVRHNSPTAAWPRACATWRSCAEESTTSGSTPSWSAWNAGWSPSPPTTRSGHAGGS